MMIGANLAVSRSFLCRRSDEWCGELMSTVSSSGNSRQRASPTEGSTSCKTNWSYLCSISVEGSCSSSDGDGSGGSDGGTSGGSSGARGGSEW